MPMLALLLGRLSQTLLALAVVTTFIAVSALVIGGRPLVREMETRAENALPNDPADVARGAGLARIHGCTDCHGWNLRGGPPPEPGAPPAPDLTDAARRWTGPEMVRTLRTGVTPDAERLDPAMPVPDIRQLSESDLHALDAYLSER